MQVKKFEAPTIQEALETVKRELGPEAIILQTKKNKKGFGLMSKTSIEVTAAVSEKAMRAKQEVDSKLNEDQVEKLQAQSAQKQAKIYKKYAKDRIDEQAARTQDKVELAGAVENRQVTARRYIDIEDDSKEVGKVQVTAPTQEVQSPPQQVQASPIAAQGASAKGDVQLLSELAQLRRRIEDLTTKQNQAEVVATQQTIVGESSFDVPCLQSAFEQLILNGVDRRMAFQLVKKVGFEIDAKQTTTEDEVLDHLAAEIMETTEVVSLLDGIKKRENGEEGSPNIIALVGPTGVGKTTTVAKVASEAILHRKLKIGLINVDSFKVGAFDQLATYAKILNVPFRSVSSSDDLKYALQDFKNFDLILVDTTGRSQKDTDALNAAKALIQEMPQVRTHLVLSSTTRDIELLDIGKRFSAFRPDTVIFSKLDEAMSGGCIYNFSQKSKLPVSYFTTGQRVPEDIEMATKERIVSLLMEL